MKRVFVFARISRNGSRARWRVDPVAHSVAETNGIGNDDLARNRRLVDDLHRTFAGCRAALVEVIRAQVHPTGANFAVINSDLSSPTGVIDSIGLIRAVGAVEYPCVYRIKSGLWDVRQIRC